MGELHRAAREPAAREWIGVAGCRNGVAAHGRTRPKGKHMAEQGGRHWDGAGLECKIRATGRPWTVGDIVMVADGQWAVDLTAPAEEAADAVVERRAADGRRVEMTLEELARAVGACFGDTRRDDTTG